MKFSIKSMMLLMVIFALHTSASAQQEFEWEQYDMKMTLPADFKVLENTASEFRAKGDGMEMEMYVFESHKVTAADMKTETAKVAKELGITYVDHWETVKDKNFEGLYVEGADKNGNKILLCGLINNKSAANFWITIEFNDGDHTAEKDGVAILNSIR